MTYWFRGYGKIEDLDLPVNFTLPPGKDMLNDLLITGSRTIRMRKVIKNNNDFTIEKKYTVNFNEINMDSDCWIYATKKIDSEKFVFAYGRQNKVFLLDMKRMERKDLDFGRTLKHPYHRGGSISDFVYFNDSGVLCSCGNGFSVFKLHNTDDNNSVTFLTPFDRWEENRMWKISKSSKVAVSCSKTAKKGGICSIDLNTEKIFHQQNLSFIVNFQYVSSRDFIVASCEEDGIIAYDHRSKLKKDLSRNLGKGETFGDICLSGDENGIFFSKIRKREEDYHRLSDVGLSYLDLRMNKVIGERVLLQFPFRRYNNKRPVFRMTSVGKNGVVFCAGEYIFKACLVNNGVHIDETVLNDVYSVTSLDFQEKKIRNSQHEVHKEDEKERRVFLIENLSNFEIRIQSEEVFCCNILFLTLL